MSILPPPERQKGDVFVDIAIPLTGHQVVQAEFAEIDKILKEYGLLEIEILSPVARVLPKTATENVVL